MLLRVASEHAQSKAASSCTNTTAANIMSAASMAAEAHDATFLITSAFSVDSGIRPRTVYRNLCPAELYEMVSTQS